MTPLSERMVETAARASHNANLGGFRPWDVLAQASAEGSTFAAVVMEGQRAAARAALTAALAVAEGELDWATGIAPTQAQSADHLAFSNPRPK